VPVVLVPAARVVRWFDNFADRHGTVDLSVGDGALRARAADGSTARARLPFDGLYDGPATPVALAGAVAPPGRWGVLLVRRGGFAVARLQRDEVTASKVGRRHVQGRTKAGGQSQQRFARRRGNQAQAAYAAAGDHAVRVLAGGVGLLVTGGDRPALEQCLSEPRLADLVGRVDSRWLPTPDPRRSVLDAALADAQAVAIDVTNAP
jgi:hypothetical protein